ncbi:MAG: RidA family protein [Saprospirales bacterium]|nr:MAG: RidA family protein [Saprospirales bacterium]
MKKIIHTDRAPNPLGPYSQAVKVNGFTFVSGQIAIDPQTGEMVADDIESETHKVLENLRQVLLAANSDLEGVVKCSIFVRDINQYARINEVYTEFFKGTQPPARELVEVSKLPKGANVEISAIAV